MALSGPRVQLGLSVTLLSSALGANELKAGRDAVDGLNKPLFLPPLKKTTRQHITEGLIGSHFNMSANCILYTNTMKCTPCSNVDR